MNRRYVAVDLGAGSGRVVVGRFDDDALHVEILHRFPNQPHVVEGHERWNVRALMEGISQGLGLIAPYADEVASIGVDTWGVDYGLIDARGRLIEDPVCYRDARTEGAVERVHELVPRTELFRVAGLQTLPFNTIYQIDAQRHEGEWPDEASRLLMMPDLFHHLLSGSTAGEVTIASTTELLSARTRRWAADLLDRLDMPFDALPSLVEPGSRLGTLTPGLQDQLGLPPIPIVAPASHDTASAVVGAPLEEGWAYLSSGTWSLLGVERHAPLLTEAVARENFTNEAGAEGTTRLLKNIMGLWVLESCRGEWERQGTALTHAQLFQAMTETEPFVAFIDPDDPRFFHPDSMVGEVLGYLRETGQPAPDAAPALARIVLESLALRYASVVRRLEAITGERVRGVRIIGGGSRNRFLNQATASACGLPVHAGPVEATALGNLVIQAIADGRFAAVAAARRYVAEHATDERFLPEDDARWADARRRFARLEAGTAG